MSERKCMGQSSFSRTCKRGVTRIADCSLRKLAEFKQATRGGKTVDKLQVEVSDAHLYLDKDEASRSVPVNPSPGLSQKRNETNLDPPGLHRSRCDESGPLHT